MENFRLRNIKSFQDSGEIEIRPITIFIGRNSSGKSSLIRFPLVLKQSFNEHFSGPLIFDGDYVDYGGDYSDVVFNHNVNDPISFSFTFSGKEVFKPDNLANRFGMENRDSIISVNVTIRNLMENNIKRLVVELFEIKINEETVYKADYKHEKNAYQLINEEERTYKIEFNGIFPSDVKRPINLSKDISQSELEKQRAIDTARFAREVVCLYFEKILTKIDYIGPYRTIPNRDYRLMEGIYTGVGKEGKTATHILAQRSLQNDEKFLNEVNEWFINNLMVKLNVKSIEGNKFEIIVTDLETNRQSNLADVGFGISQIFPIVVQTYLQKVETDDFWEIPNIQIIEQPELHLHPHAQSNLADLFITGYKAEPNKRFLIETHSRNLILRLRRRVAEGIISPEDVAIYYVKPGAQQGDFSTVERLHINDLGEIPDWPDQFFDQAYQDVIAIKSAKKKSQRDKDDTVW